MRGKTRKSIVSMLVAAVMCLSMLPMTALSAESGPPSSYTAHGYTITVTPLGKYDNGTASYDTSDGWVKIMPPDGSYKVGFCDLQGTLVMEPKYKYDSISSAGFSNGLCAVRVYNEWTGTSKWGYMDKKGNTVIEPIYDGVKDFVDGTAEVWIGNKYFFIDTSGAVVADISYDNGETVITDKNGVVRHDLFSYRSDKLEHEANVKIVQGGGKYGVADKDGKMIVPYRYNFITTFNLGLAPANLDSMSGVIDEKGNVIVPFEWLASSQPFSDDGVIIAMWPGASQQYVLQIQNEQTPAATTPTAPPVPAASNKPSSWAEKDVTTAITANLVPQALQGNYTQATTRAEFCALAVSLYETVQGTEITQRKTFDDTTDVNVEKAAGLGIVSGGGENKFAPDGTLTREQAATMLSRLASAVGRPLAAQTATFADSGSISSWAASAVGEVQASGIMGGVGNNAFAPQDSYTREQSVVTILRLYDTVKDMMKTEPTPTPTPTPKRTDSVTSSTGSKSDLYRISDFTPPGNASWTSSDKSVAYEDCGMLIAVAPGKAVIDCVLLGESIYSLIVTVEGSPEPEPDLPSEPVYATEKLMAGQQLNMSSLTGLTSSDTNVAYVDAASQLIAVAPGTTTVQGKNRGGETVIITVTVTAAEEEKPQDKSWTLSFDPAPVMGEVAEWQWTHDVGNGMYAPDLKGMWYFYSDGWYYGCKADGTVFIRSQGNNFTVGFGVSTTPPAPNGPTPGLPTAPSA